MSTAFSPGRVAALAMSEIRRSWKRPIILVLFAILVLSSWGLAGGGLRISTGSADTGGMKAWLNSEFNIAFMDLLLLGTILPFFTAVACGTAAAVDEERRFDRLLHATPLSPFEYVLGRFLGALVPIVLLLLAWKGVQIAFMQFYPIDDPERLRGPFSLVAYLRPLVVLTLPLVVVMAGTSFLLGTWTRQAALVFALPTIFFIASIFFLWSFSPIWLPTWIDRLMQWCDPAGFRWMSETYLSEDRGAAFYNATQLDLDPAFAASRLAFVAIGLGSVLATAGIVRRRLRGRSPAVDLAALPPSRIAELPSLAGAGPLPESTQRAAGFLATTWAVLRKEVRWLLRSPGLYIFGPLILVQTIATSLVRPGPLDTMVLHSSGTIAASTFNTLTLLLVLLVLYYGVESLAREEKHRVDRIVGASSAPTAALLVGKVLANALLALVVIAAAFLAAVVVLLMQGLKTPIEPSVFAFVWIVLLAPTLIVWSAFTIMLQALLRNRYATWCVGLGVLVGTGFLTQFGWMNWVSRWHLWSGVLWSDLDRLGFVRTELLWNRLFVLALAFFFVVVALRAWPRRVADARAVLDRLRPAALLRGSIGPLVALLPAACMAIGMLAAMRAGREGGPREREAKDYWRANSATWEDAPVPALESLVADVDLRPATRSLVVHGTMVVRNQSDAPMDAIPLTVRPHLEASGWTIDGVPSTPVDRDGPSVERPSIENRSGLFLVRPAAPLAPGEDVAIGFRVEGALPYGWSKRPSSASEFVLPSGVVLTSFTGSFLPLVGFSDGVGIDDENARDAKEFAENHWQACVDPLFGPAWPTSLELRVTGPADWTINSVGVPVESTVDGARRTTTWRTDHPVRFFNLVGGPLVERAGTHSSVHHDPRHSGNIDRMVATLDAARTHYGEWFGPYPWRDLKITEFPGLASYAQGFPGNISFSESIGFLTKSAGEGEADAVVFVTAHEAAHQWWGNILTPGRGPGGNVISEGMANFSAAMLVERIESPSKRRALLRTFEDQYVNGRSPDNERPLHRVDGTRPGDTTTTYDRGGWAFWMLKDAMGEERMLAGLRDFIERFRDGPDYPLIEDMMAVLREHAGDVARFDAFVGQWIFGTALPEFEVDDVRAERATDGADWIVRGVLRNNGTGTVEVDVAAFIAGEGDERTRSTTSVVVAAGGSVPFEIRCAFAPATVVVDPDVRVLQIGRKRATHSIALP